MGAPIQRQALPSESSTTTVKLESAYTSAISTSKSSNYQAMKASDKNAAKQATQRESAESILTSGQKVPAFSRIKIKFKTKKDRSKANKKEKAGKKEGKKKIQAVGKIRDSVNKYSQKRNALSPAQLKALHSRVNMLFKEGIPVNKSIILKMVKEACNDNPDFQFQALKFLEDTANTHEIPEEQQTALRDAIDEAKEALFHDTSFRMNLGDTLDEVAGAFGQVIDISMEVDGIEFEGSPEEKLNLFFRDLVENPRESTIAIFHEIEKRAGGDPEQVSLLIKFHHSATGCEYRKEGTEIMPGRMHQLTNRTRDLQAYNGVLGVFRHCDESRIQPLITHLLESSGVSTDGLSA